MRVYAFIDSQNVNLAIRSTGWILDFEKFFIFLKRKYHVQKAYVFLGYLSKNESLYNRLKAMGYNIIFKPTVEMKNKTVKGNCDAELVLHCMIEFPNFDKTIIVSGDGDFYCLIDYLGRQDKLLNVGIPNRFQYSSLLKKFRDQYFFYISDLQEKLEYKKR